MKITAKLLKSIGYYKLPTAHDPFLDLTVKHEYTAEFFNDSYPFNQIKIVMHHGKFKLVVNCTHYDCSTLDKLLSAVYFSGINRGQQQKMQQIKKELGIP